MAVALALLGSSARATTYSCNGLASTFYDVPGDWTPSGPPGSADTASFGTGAFYNVFLRTSPTVNDLNVLAGTPTFSSFIQPPLSYGPQTLTVSDALSIPNSNGNTLVTLGGLGLVPLTLSTLALSIQNGGSLTVQDGSTLNTSNSSINGNVLIDGGAQWNDNSGPNYGIGIAGGDGSVTIQNGGTATFFLGLNVAADSTSSTGIVRVDGANSMISSGLDVSVGSHTVGQGTINVGTVASGGTMTTLDGTPMHIYTTGTVTVGSTTTTGTLNPSGEVYVDGGILRVYSGSQFNLAPGETLYIQNGGTADFRSFNINGSKVEFDSGTLSYAGNLLVGTNGVLGGSVTLDATRHLSLTGTTTVDPFYTLALTDGSLHTSSVVNNGTLTLTSGTLNTTTATLNSSGALQITLSGKVRDTNYCALAASGNVSLAGSLVVTLNSFTPAIGDTFDILDGTLSGTFAPLTLPALPADRTWNTANLYTTGVLAVVAVAGVPGDYNGDGVVDAADYTVWRDTLGSTTDRRADGNGDGIVNQLDYQFWKDNYPKPHMGRAAGVPEPSMLTLVLMGTIALVGWGRADLRLR
jgi:hypothetical protein